MLIADAVLLPHKSQPPPTSAEEAQYIELLNHLLLVLRSGGGAQSLLLRLMLRHLTVVRLQLRLCQLPSSLPVGTILRFEADLVCSVSKGFIAAVSHCGKGSAKQPGIGCDSCSSSSWQNCLSAIMGTHKQFSSSELARDQGLGCRLQHKTESGISKLTWALA